MWREVGGSVLGGVLEREVGGSVLRREVGTGEGRRGREVIHGKRVCSSKPLHQPVLH